MKQLFNLFIVFLLSLISIKSVFAYDLSEKDKTKGEVIANKIETLIKKKGEKNRILYLNALEKLKTKYNKNQKIETLISLVIEKLKLENSNQYQNDKYGFIINLPDSWKGKYEIIELINDSVFKNEIDLDFYLPTNNENFYTFRKTGFGVFFTIRIIDINDWNDILEKCKKDGTINSLSCPVLDGKQYIAKNKKYIFEFSFPQDQPEDWAQFNGNNNGNRIEGVEYLEKNFKVIQ